jgi:hypothetical protein
MGKMVEYHWIPEGGWGIGERKVCRRKIEEILPLKKHNPCANPGIGPGRVMKKRPSKFQLTGITLEQILESTGSRVNTAHPADILSHPYSLTNLFFRSPRLHRLPG